MELHQCPWCGRRHQTYDCPNHRGAWPAVGASDEESARRYRAERRGEVFVVLGFLVIAAAIAAVLVWLMNR